MSSFTDTMENEVLDFFFLDATTTINAGTPYLALFTANPTDAGGGTEVSGNGYARQSITFGAASGGAMSNTGAVSFTASGGNFGTVTGVAIFDSLTGGTMMAWDAITSATINDGDTLNFAVGDIDITLD